MGLGEDERSLKQMSHKMPFKSRSRNFHWLASRENFTGISLVSFTRITNAKHFVKSWKTWELDRLTPNWAYTWNGSRKHPENMFFTHKQLEKIWKTWVIQITSESKQKEQKSFSFDPYMVEHTHITFEHVQSHKWNRHSLNIRLECCVCVSNVE